MARKDCPNKLKGCPYAPNCFSDVHHLYFPRARYKTAMEKAFRELFTIQICRYMHDELHDTATPPPKPTRQFMLNKLNQHRRTKRKRR